MPENTKTDQKRQNHKTPPRITTQWQAIEQYFKENPVNEFVLHSLNDAPKLNIFKNNLIVLDNEHIPEDGALIIGKSKRLIIAYQLGTSVDDFLESVYSIQLYKKDSKRLYTLPLNKSIEPNFAVISFVLTGKGGEK